MESNVATPLAVDHAFRGELKRYGLIDNNLCYHCGTCTATCGLTEEGSLFPRQEIRSVQLGLKEKLGNSVEPWLCYYCGECSSRCPREANPAEQMMTLRRYLTACYDWTGLSAKLNTSLGWHLGFLGLVSAVVVGLFAGYHLLHPGQIVWDLRDGYVHLNSFAPVSLIHRADLLLGAILSFFLLSNIYRMYRKILLSDKNLKIPFSLYLKKLWTLPTHFATQLRFSKCDKKWNYWVAHFFLMSGYALMFYLIMLNLASFQLEQGVNWTTGIGYYCTFGLFYGTGVCIVGRWRKTDENHKYSHFTDWTFLLLLFFTTLSGILLHLFRYWLAWPAATYYMYVIHLAIDVPMLIVMVPFSKWSHLAYRPLAIYFAEIRKAALVAGNLGGIR